METGEELAERDDLTGVLLTDTAELGEAARLEGECNSSIPGDELALRIRLVN